MTAASNLVSALNAVDWNSNVSEFCSDVIAVEDISSCNLRLALWSREIESIDPKNPANCFIREMQSSGHIVAASTALAIYKAAAASTRTVVESALYYTYFRTHLPELATLVRDDKWYISKQEIIDYHVQHTPDFQTVQKKLPVVALLNPWYSKISSIVHGQIPGAWHHQGALARIKHDRNLRDEVILRFKEGTDVVNRLFLITVARDSWEYFSTSTKGKILKGLSGDIKVALGLDSA